MRLCCGRRAVAHQAAVELGMKLALYKGKGQIGNALIRWWTRSSLVAFVARNGCDKCLSLNARGEPLAKRLLVDSTSPRPSAKSVRDPANGYLAARALVGALLRPCSPSAVFRRVGAVNINPVDGKIIPWARPHIFNKIVKRVDPSLADANPSAAVVLERGVIRVFAALFHALPDSPLCGPRHFVAGCSFGSEFLSKAFARFYSSAKERVAKCFVLVPAVTNARPSSVFAWPEVVGSSQNDKPAKSHSSEVFKTGIHFALLGCQRNYTNCEMKFT